MNKEEQLRSKIKEELTKAKAAGDRQRMQQLVDVYNKLPPESYVFDQLKTNDAYTGALRQSWKMETGKDWEGDIQDLIEKDFEYWNTVENNLTLGAAELGLNYLNMSDEEKQAALTRFNIYDKTKATGAGSRPFWEQFKGVSSALLSDPLTYTGVGLAAKLFPKLGGRTVIRQALAAKATQGAGGAAWAAASDLEKQAIEKELGGREQIDFGQTAQAGLTGAVVAPVASTVTRTVGAGAGAVGRAITQPGQTLAGVAARTLPGEAQRAAATGVTRQAVEGLQPRASETAAEEVTAGLQGAFNTVKGVIDSQYDALNPNRITSRTSLGMIDRWASMPGLKVPDSVSRLKTKLEAGNVEPVVALRELRREAQAAMDSVKSGRGDFRQSDMPMLIEIKTSLTKALEDAAKGTSVNTRKLDKANAIFMNLNKTPMGRKILEAEQDPIAAQKLIASFGTKDGAQNMNELMSKLDVIDNLAGNKDLTSPLRETIKDGFAALITKDEGKQMLKIMQNPGGVKMLKKLYPDMAKDFDNIIEIGTKLGNTRMSNSVIANMAIARVGGYVGGTLGGRLGGAGGALLSVSGFHKLLESKVFQDAMVKSLKRGDKRFDTRMRKWLNGKGYTDDAIDAIQDYMWGLTTVVGGVSAADQLGSLPEKVSF